MRPDPSKLDPRVKAVLQWDVPATARSLEEKYPETWRRMHVRSIQAPSWYYSSKALSIGLTGAIEEARQDWRSSARSLGSNVGIIAGVLESHDFPLYYVSRPLIDALGRSHPPEGMLWNDVKLPFPGLCFMLPKGSLVEPPPLSKEIILVGVARLSTTRPLPIPTLGNAQLHPSVVAGEDRICVFYLLGPSGLEMNDTTFPSSHPLEPNADWINSKTGDRPYHGPPTDFTVQVAGLVANMVLVMEARRELIEHGTVISEPRKGRRGIYSPTYIGRNYAILRKDSPEGERRSKFTELGWRAGHFKRQRHGPGNSESKTIFIDPYIAYVRGLEPVGGEG